MVYKYPVATQCILLTAMYQVGGGRLSTVPFVRINITVVRGELSTVPCVRLSIAEGGRLSTVPVVRFIYELVWSLGEGTVSDRPPPVSGGSKLNNLTCGVERKKTVAPGSGVKNEQMDGVERLPVTLFFPHRFQPFSAPR